MSIEPHNIETLVSLHRECVVALTAYNEADSSKYAGTLYETYNDAEQRFKAYAQELMKEESK